MQKMSDEMLMAYTDDALSPKERRQVEAALAADPSLQSRLEPFVVTRSALPEIFSEALTSPMPDHLVKTVRTAPGPKRSLLSSGAVSGNFLARVRELLFPEHPSFGNAVALAAIVLAVAGTAWLSSGGSLAPSGSDSRLAPQIAQSATPPAPPNSGTAYADGALASALETAPLAKSVVSDGVEAVATSTFFDRTGHVCRQYDASNSAASERFSGFACRTADGRWQIGFHAAAPKPAPEAGDAFVPAGDNETFTALETAIDAVIDGDVLDVGQEAALLANGWRREERD